MTVFISHAAADEEVAEQLEKFLERRGQFVERDDGEMALRPLHRSDVLILLISQKFVMSLHRLRLEQRALDAWASGRLILVKLDHAFAPVGLRDLPSIDASFEARREFTWNDVARAIQEKLRAPATPEEAGEDADDDLQPPPPQAPVAAKKSGGAGRAFLLFVLALPGLGALAVSGSIWLANRIGPVPGTFGDLLESVDAFGRRYGLPTDITPILFGVAIALTGLCFLLAIAGLFAPRAEIEPPEPVRAPERSATAPAAASDAVFVSYARANSGVVLPVIEGAQHAGKRFWLDQQGGIKAGDGWAGEIVKAIRGAPKVLVMCSKAAFESDHVKREIYLADRYKKRLLPVFVEEAQPPEDFEYFFAGVQWLNLFETPEADRPAALLKLLEA